MFGMILDALVLCWAMAREKEDLEDGEERTLPALRTTSPCRGGRGNGKEAAA